MRSATSYFNGTLYRKTLARFWPLWGLYSLVWLFFIPLSMLSSYFDRYLNPDPVRRLLSYAARLPEYIMPGLFFVAFFAILYAMAVFGYLYNHRSACWTHALPLRREALFITQYLAGLTMLLLPQGAVTVLTAMIELAFLPMGSWGGALSALGTWLIALTGLCLFFFSFAAFCAMFTGHILALPTFYCILNVLAAVIYELLDGLFHQFFFGYDGSRGAQKAAEYLTPFLPLREASGWLESSGLKSPATIAAYAAVGIVLTLISLSVYRRRHIETAGDVVTIPLVRPLFKYGVSFCSGLAFGIFTSAFFGWRALPALIPCILFWTVMGYFAAEMLLKKSFRVFKAWKGAAVMTAVMLALCLVCTMDLLGVATRVPSPDKVDSLSVQLHLGYPDDDGRDYIATLTEPENIQRFIELHQAIVGDRARLNQDSPSFDCGNDYAYLTLSYTLKGGSTLARDYGGIPLYREDLDREGSVTNLFQKFLEDRALAADAYGFADFLKDGRLTGAWLDRLYNAKGEMEYSVYVDDYAQELWDAVQADFAQGTIGVRYLFDMGEDRQANTFLTDLTFNVTGNRFPDAGREGYSVQATPGGSKIDRTLAITLTPNAKHTLAVLEEAGIFEEGYTLILHSDSDESGGWAPHTSAW